MPVLKESAQSTSIETKHYNFVDFLNGGKKLNLPKAAIRQYMTMYERTKQKDKPVILELGTRKGISTTMFLQVCQENGGHLYSVDIEDFSDIFSGDNWTFILSDSVAIDKICNKYPELKNGIDILLIDSLHKRSHVEKEMYGWFPLLNKNAIIFFDDLDPNPYRQNHRKDSLHLEFDWQNMQDGVLDIFHSNEEDYTLEIMYGSTGLGTMTKETELGTPLKQASITYRTKKCFWSTLIKIFRLKQKLLGHPY